MPKRRIISVLMVLLLTLGVALPGIKRKLTFYERKDLQNTSDKLRKLCKELPESMEAVQMQKIEGPELQRLKSSLTPRQLEALEAYEAFLENYTRDYDGEWEDFESEKSFKGPKFTLVYLNDDEIPELAIVDDWAHGNGVGYYIYTDGEVVFIGEYGQYGGNSYAEKESIIFSEYDGAGVTHRWTYRIEGTKEILLQSSDIYIHWESEDPEYTYIVDQKEVTEEEYRAACEMWDHYEEKIVAYDRCFLMLDGAIKENLNKAIEELVFEEDLLAYWRVLNNEQPFVSTNEDYQEFYWNEYNWWLGRQVEYHHADSFMLVDMDGDGGNEVVLYCSPESTQVLHYEDGVVYGYQFGFRGMKRIHQNGVYEGSDGAASTSYHRLTELNKEGCTEETIAVFDHYYDYYEVEGVEVTYEKLADYVQSIEDVALAETVEFTEDMLACRLLGKSAEGTYER